MADLQVLKALLPDNPLCGISTYKDTLNLATGACIRQIKKLVLTGEEDWMVNAQTKVFYCDISQALVLASALTSACTHYRALANLDNYSLLFDNSCCIRWNNSVLWIRDLARSDVDDFKTYLAQQYANGTPVTVWYVLATSTTETIAVPSGLSGTEEGYLNQSGTPTPTNPIYPTANNVEIWQHSLRKLTTATEDVENPLYSDGTAITNYTIKGNTVQNGTPTPSNPVEVNGVGELDGGQYKIPISSGGVTTNIYLGSTQTVRQIKKLVLDGTENWSEGACAVGYRFNTTITSAMPSDTTIGVRSMCTHQQLTSTGNTYNTLGVYTITGSSNLIMTLNSDTRLASWKSWLAAQYANGTPVTIWYVLTTPETATVNEPLMKIGDYADTLSNATAIPTTEGANSITVDTTVQPSEFTATWTGWHDATVKEWDGSQWG